MKEKKIWRIRGSRSDFGCGGMRR